MDHKYLQDHLGLFHWHLGFIQIWNRNTGKPSYSRLIWGKISICQNYKILYVTYHIENIYISQGPILCGQDFITGSALMSRPGFFAIVSLIVRNSYYWSVWKQFVFLRLITPCKAHLIRFVNSHFTKGKVKPFPHLGIIKCFKGTRSKLTRFSWNNLINIWVKW